MVKDPLDKYNKQVREEQLISSTVQYFLTMAPSFNFDNDSLLRIGKGINEKIVKIIADLERSENPK